MIWESIDLSDQEVLVCESSDEETSNTSSVEVHVGSSSSSTESIMMTSQTESENIDEILNDTFAQEKKTDEKQFKQSSVILENAINSSNDEQDENSIKVVDEVSECQKKNCVKFNRRQERGLFDSIEHLPVIIEEEQVLCNTTGTDSIKTFDCLDDSSVYKGIAENPEEIKVQKTHCCQHLPAVIEARVLCNVTGDESAKGIDRVGDGSNEIKVQKPVNKNIGNGNEIQVEVMMEVIRELKQKHSQNKAKCEQSEVAETPVQEKNSELDKISECSNTQKSNLDAIKPCANKLRKNAHPIFISDNGQIHELLLKHKKVMQLTRPSPYANFRKCMDLRRYFGGFPDDFECSKHKEENRVPLWMQKYLYDYRLFLRNMQDDVEEEYYLKRLMKPEEQPSKDYEKRGFAKICRLCGEKAERFVTVGHHVVIKLVSVYLPLVIVEGNKVPLGLCDKCDYSLALICSFMLTYLDCPKLEKNEKKCFTCRCAIENLLNLVDKRTMMKLATALFGIRFNLSEFMGNGLKYLCSACRVSFELLESYREMIWLTNKLFEDMDEKLFQSEESYKNQHVCVIPPEVYDQPKPIHKRFQSSIDNCSVEAIAGSQEFDPRKFFLKRRQRHRIVKFFSRLFGRENANKEKRLFQRSQKEQLDGNATLSLGLEDLVQESMESLQNLEKLDRSLQAVYLPNITKQLEEAKEKIKDAEKDQSVFQSCFGKMENSLFAYFNAEVDLPAEMLETEKDRYNNPQPSTSGSTEMLVDNEVYI